MKEILCPAHKGISGKCNALLRKNYIYSFCSINEKKTKQTKNGSRNGKKSLK